MKCMRPFPTVDSVMIHMGPELGGHFAPQLNPLLASGMDQEIRQHHLLDRPPNGQVVTADDVRALNGIDLLNTVGIRGVITRPA
jgi:hypothetical protein